MDPLEEAKYKDTILKHLQRYKHHFIDYGKIAQIYGVRGISDGAVTYLMEAIEKDGFIRTDLTLSGRTACIEDRADYFLEQGGYEAQIPRTTEAERKRRKVERQENFIRFTKVIKSGAWLFGFVISVLLNLYFILKYWLKLF